MRILILLITALTLSNISLGQKLIEELSDFYSPELIIENSIREVIIEVKDVPRQKLTFDKSGKLITETEFKNWATGDTTIKYFTYINNLKTQMVHIDKSSGDTLSYDNFIYEDEVLIGIEGVISTNSTKTDFEYYDNGNLKELIFLMTFSSGTDTSRIDYKYYDKLGRIVKFDRVPYSGITESSRFIYAENTLVTEKEDKENGEFYVSEKVYFNENLQMEKIIKYKKRVEEVQSTIGFIYSDKGLIQKLTMNGKDLAVYTYSYFQ